MSWERHSDTRDENCQINQTNRTVRQRCHLVTHNLCGVVTDTPTEHTYCDRQRQFCESERAACSSRQIVKTTLMLRSKSALLNKSMPKLRPREAAFHCQAPAALLRFCLSSEGCCFWTRSQVHLARAPLFEAGVARARGALVFRCNDFKLEQVRWQTIKLHAESNSPFLHLRPALGYGASPTIHQTHARAHAQPKERGQREVVFSGAQLLVAAVDDEFRA